MRDGYKLVSTKAPNTRLLVSPGEAPIASVISRRVNHLIRPRIPRVAEMTVGRGEGKLEEALDVVVEAHYMRTTTSLQRFHIWRREFLGDPIWGWLAFVVATAVAVVGWIS